LNPMTETLSRFRMTPAAVRNAVIWTSLALRVRIAWRKRAVGIRTNPTISKRYQYPIGVARWTHCL